MVPVAGDYNGDGASDLAVYRRSDGRWFIRTLGGQVLKWNYQWGYNGAVPVAGDYDGDGISDLVVCDTNSYVWYGVRMSGTTLFWNLQWGYSGCRLVSGSYDTSGVSHLAVYANEGGQYRWFVRRTNTNAAVIYYNRALGVTGDWVAPGNYEGYGLDYLGVYRPAPGTWHILMDRNTNGISDGWEYKYFNGLTVDPNGDVDNDGLTNLAEYERGTDPTNGDSDDDGLSDGMEVNQYNTDPLKADTDNDELGDGVEVNQFTTDPLNADTDGDGLTDGEEVGYYASNPLNQDTDGDGMCDGWEVAYGLSVLLDDAGNDNDHDGFSNVEEYTLGSGSDPANPLSIPGPAVYVAVNGGGSANGAYTNPYPNIYTAISNAQTGSRIVIFEGVYTGALNRGLSFAGKGLHISPSSTVVRQKIRIS